MVFAIELYALSVCKAGPFRCLTGPVSYTHLDVYKRQAQHCVEATAEVVGELSWRDLRLVVAHDPEGAAESRILRREKIQALETQAAAWVGKLDAQDAGVKARGKRLSDSGAKARLYHAVKDGRLAHIVRVDLKNERCV